MSEFKGVKGPWVSEGYDVYAGDMDAHICIVSSFIDEETEDAHVNLIAAAPDLLNMLQATTLYIEKNANDGSGIIRAVLDASNAAIAKALGQ